MTHSPDQRFQAIERDLASHPQQVEPDIRILLQQARENDDAQLKARALVSLGGSTFYQRRYSQTIEILEEALPIVEQLGLKALESRCFNGLALAWHNVGEYEEAIGYYVGSVKLSAEIGDDIGVARALGNLSILSRSARRHELTLQMLAHARQRLEGWQRSPSYVGNTLALIWGHVDAGQLGKAYQYYELAKSDQRFMESPRIQASLRAFEAIYQTYQGEYALALKSAQALADFTRRRPEADPDGLGYFLLGYVHILHSEWELAEAALLETFRMSSNELNELMAQQANQQLVTVYEGLGEREKAEERRSEFEGFRRRLDHLIESVLPELQPYL